MEEPFLPPGLSKASRMVASLSISPALRRALVAMAFEPAEGAGAGVENMMFADLSLAFMTSGLVGIDSTVPATLVGMLGMVEMVVEGRVWLVKAFQKRQ